ncbi:hypothetical protein GCM10009868_11170 [Terrabacter aerolatus]|uniref:Putative zinc-finger domain-containing protein n=1 Tax=Terrabacter aerolatus TaxID=422442 RepID=A0A512D3X2_9MICO|nr:zf-HC2 domain-containing protein [Terrabacter aerolatus]GEO31166.1 hypothetical protein TAE01_29760 [Terrabacter aerolatus]
MGRSDDGRAGGHEDAAESAESSGFEGVERPDGAGDDAAEVEARDAVWAAWRSLTDESRSLLWRLVVHEEHPRQIAPALGTTSSGVATQSRQARVRLRQALLTEVVAHATDPVCREVRRHLGGYVRDSLTPANRHRVEDHLDGCPRCRAALADVVDVDAAIRLRVAPALLPGAFAPPEAMADDSGAGAGAAVGEGPAPGLTPEDSSVPLAVGVAPVVGSAESGAWGPAGRVLSVPGRSAAAVLAAAAVVAAVALFLFQLEPTGGVTAGRPTRSGASTGSVGGAEPTYPPDGTPDAVAPRPVIGVATAEGVSRRQPPGGRSSGSGVTGDAGSAVRQALPTTRAGSSTGASNVHPSPTRPVPTPSASTSVPSSPTAPPTSAVPGPVGTVTSLRLAPSDRGCFAHLEAPTGWLITSVRDLRGGRQREHVSSPTSVYDGRLAGGDIVIEVTRVRPDLTGVLTALFTDASGAPLPGSGTYPLR